jgi:hypothetical protein
MPDFGEHGAKQAEHTPVLSKHLAGKGLDAPMPGFFSNLREKQLAHPLRLPPVFHDEGHLGIAAICESHVHSVADDLLLCDGYEGILIVMIYIQHKV